MSDPIRRYYEDNPLMVSSPFGGVDGINRLLFDCVLRRLGIDLRGRSILDVGCGRGYVGDVVVSAGGNYTGVDIVPSRSGFRLAVASATALPFPAQAFDGLFCIDVFEHIPDAAAAAAEFRRVLRPGGFVFLSVPNYGNVAGLVKWACETFGGYEKRTWAPFRHWQPQEHESPLTRGGVERHFRGAGFRAAACLGHAPEVGLGLFPWIEHAKMPEAIMFWLQRLFARLGPAAVRVWPGSSLHLFWHFQAH